MKKTGIETENDFCYSIDTNSYFNNMLYGNKETDGQSNSGNAGILQYSYYDFSRKFYLYNKVQNT